MIAITTDTFLAYSVGSILGVITAIIVKMCARVFAAVMNASTPALINSIESGATFTKNNTKLFLSIFLSNHQGEHRRISFVAFHGCTNHQHLEGLHECGLLVTNGRDSSATSHAKFHNRACRQGSTLVLRLPTQHRHSPCDFPTSAAR